MTEKARTAVVVVRIRTKWLWRKRWVRMTSLALAIPAVLLCFAAGYYYVTFSRLIDERLQGERIRVLPRVFARPLELRRGQAMTEPQLVDRLNDLGYAERTNLQKPGEFAIEQDAVAIYPRSHEFKNRVVRVVFRKPVPPPKPTARGRKPPPPPKPKPADHVEVLELGMKPTARVTLDAPLLTSLIGGEREKRRPVELSAIPERVVQAVLAIEDRRYFDHPGFDPIGIIGALVRNLRGNTAYTAGGSTITQQVVRNVFLPKMFPGMTLQEARAKTWSRKALEIWVSIVMTTKASKDEILGMYLNDMTLGQRGSFAVVGVAEAARLFFGKDISNVTLAEAATIAGVYQSPSALSPFNNPDRCRDRRNVVLEAMADSGYISREAADAAIKEPLVVEQRALEAEAPYFVDYVGQTLAEDYPGLMTSTNEPVDVYTTLDLHLQRVAQDAVRDGLTQIDKLLANRKRKGRAEAALIALDPKTGEILAFVGGRSYNQSQFNRVAALRQPGSVFKPFVFLTAFEQAADEGRTDVTPASVVDDEPATFLFNDEEWTPENYEGEYDGPITYRRALAQSRNLATIHVAEAAGYDRVAEFWRRLGVGTPPKAFPSIALGVFEATPLEIATVYTLFPNGGVLRPVKNILTINKGGKDATRKEVPAAKRIARPETTFLVTDMMRGVINEGTAAGARGLGFTLDAAGKTGTTNDLRDAWFVGFTPELLTVVWVGFDDNQILGLSGGRAALPIWTQFMKSALAGLPNVPFEAPEGMSFVDIDPDTGHVAAPACPRVYRQAFLAGTAPYQVCELHRF